MYHKGPRWTIAPRPGEIHMSRSGCNEREKRRRLGKMEALKDIGPGGGREEDPEHGWNN